MGPQDHLRNVERAERIARRMDAALRIPGTGIRVGYDSILGLVPGIGDTLALAPSAYIVKLAHDSGAPPHLIGRMGFNLGVDWVIGLVPLLGDIFDVGWKANLRNAALLREHVEARNSAATARSPTLSGRPAVANP
ncbi:DUF4112 domain-containing protein [Sagittula salina]|uniref:DUF4112 domain-containing protein n=1 Tax=Sagittula salina TaxID=2820268 RepID=A0A940RZI0_9RHOB|nr:DUF4112 domain-containing protein [Sagittula salina]MBP0481007.1 DUF4112 domain-containing protein [Sagittula salina]